MAQNSVRSLQTSELTHQGPARLLAEQLCDGKPAQDCFQAAERKPCYAELSRAEIFNRNIIQKTDTISII